MHQIVYKMLMNYKQNMKVVDNLKAVLTKCCVLTVWIQTIQTWNSGIYDLEKFPYPGIACGNNVDSKASCHVPEAV